MQEMINAELLVLIPLLAGIGNIIKSSKIDDSKIPLILCIISVVLTSIYVFSVMEITGFSDVLKCVFTSIVQGLLCALTTVGGHQAIKQTSKNG